jgi:signal transduction histidine kinase
MAGERTVADTVLIMAPVGADAANIGNVLQSAGLASRVCRTTEELRAGITEDCGTILLTQEALTFDVCDLLAKLFAVQPPWSDIPVVLITSSGAANTSSLAAAKLRGRGRTLTLLERPLRATTLLSSLQTLLAARHRQYEIRDLLHERDALLSSLESRVAERTVELQRMVEEMEAFSYSVSHDLRSPLRSIDGYARALQEDYADNLPPGARAYLDKIARAARRMDNLTQDVLAYTRVTRCEMEIGPVDLDSLVSDVIEQYPALGATARFIAIRRPLGHVMGHVPSLVQCFSNLLGNAFKFIPEGRTPAVEVRSHREGSRCRVTVQDNGIGISPGDHARIFRMFERAVGKTIPGTGIGLAIVKKAVERMGGTVGVNSELGRGAEFWMDLPATDVPANAVSQANDAALFWKAPDKLKPVILEMAK